MGYGAQWDGFAAMERDVRAMVADPRWPLTPTQSRADAISRRALATQDGVCWLFGAYARWYRLDPDGQWHLSAPPASLPVRASTRPVTVPIPYWVVPTGPDFSVDRGSTQGFVGPDVPNEVTERVRDLIITHRGLRREDFPLTGGPFRQVFAAEVASTVAAVWGTVMWCAYAPAFDGNEVMLSMFGEFLARPLPGDEFVRWLPPVGLADLVELYAERCRSGFPDAGLRLAALMARTAKALRADARFRPRASALIAMIEQVLNQPWLDHTALQSGAVAHSWLLRCPPNLAPAALSEVSPGDHFRHVFYDLVEALAYTADSGADPRAVAASLLAADVASVTTDAVTYLYPWMDDGIRQAMYVTLAEPGHPLRGCWPVDGRLPEGLTPPDRSTAAAFLGAAYATGLAWCELAGATPPPTGFPVSAAVGQCLVHNRDDLPPEPTTTPRKRVTETTSDWLYST
ncbi:hypothetical protein Aple_068570 [Acrocarpospora pleiomorpha]|uniref:Uncharacterized protein n=1 Tax=Acrocarpospora pleiomorpha TaxID=90975 RepID=A0A5M3XZY1_9ACTN|nr:hypothetical protein [Acrocarpospora pleiomorpha]GES23958.1 hypothetical protein Aple_068570 [Acrocarpospora pleiomorpha]